MGVDVTALTAFLSPFLPFLMKAGEKAAEESGKKLGVEAWDKAKALWGKLRPKIETKDAAMEAVEDVAIQSEDEDAQASLRHQLKKVLESDKTLAEEVSRLMEQGAGNETTDNILAGCDIMISSGNKSVNQTGSGNTNIEQVKYHSE